MKLRFVPISLFLLLFALLAIPEAHAMRWYSPETGRWLSRDPIEEKSQFNLYTYCRNLPTTEFDLLGLQSVTEQQCKNAVNQAWKKSKKIAELVDNMKKHKPPCKIPVVNCACCKKEEGGHYSDTKNQIVICYNHSYSETDILDSYLHELIHGWNECTGFGGETCDEAVCDEILANYYSGACDPNGDPSEGDKSKWDCIIRRSAWSAKIFCNNSDWEARKRGWAVLKDCLKKAPKPFQK